MSPLVAVLAVLVVPGTLATSCPPDMLAVYSLALRTEWSEDRFPKQYPQWRPPAQWSKTIGELDVSGSGSGLHASNDEVNVKYEVGSKCDIFAGAVTSYKPTLNSYPRRPSVINKSNQVICAHPSTIHTNILHIELYPERILRPQPSTFI